MLEETRKKIYDSVLRATMITYDFQDVELRNIPFSGHWGFSTSVAFKIAGREARRGGDFNQLKKEVAHRIVTALEKDDEVSSIEVIDGYINIYLAEDVFARKIVERILGDKVTFPPKKERVMVEYSQPNTHHAFHIGHLRNVVLGQALVNIMRYAGYEVVAATYPGDIGIHVAKCLWCYMKFYKDKEPEEGKGEWLALLYAEGAKAFEQDEDVSKEVRELNKRLEAGESEATELWKKTRQWSLDYFDRIYSELGVRFDAIFFESNVMREGKEIAEELVRKGIAEISDGAVVVFLDKKLHTKDLGVYVLLRSDGTTLYSAKDLALAKMKFEGYNIDRSIYVIGSEQKMHLRQLFATLALWGFRQAEKCFHLSYELVMLRTGKMSSRAGNVALYDDLFRDTYGEALTQIREKGFVVDDVEETARRIALGAMKFSMLHDNNKVILFDPQESVNFEGQTAAYAQYAYARASRILEKAGERNEEPVYSTIEPSEKNLLEILSQFKEVITDASETYRSHLVSTYAFMVAKTFNEFYHTCPVLQAGEGTRERRLLLVETTRKILGITLGLVGIETVERM